METLILLGLFILSIVLTIVFVTSHKRLADAHENVAKQLEKIAENLRK